MLYCVHESIKVGSPRGKQRKAAGLGEAGPRGMGRVEDRCPAAGVGGPASGTSECFPGSEPHDSGTMDTRCESGRDSGSGIQTPARPAKSTDAGVETRAAAGSGKITPGVRSAKTCLGWADPAGSSEERFWSEAENATGSILDASVGLQSEKGWLCLSTGTCRGCSPISSGVKKNSPNSNPMKRSCFRMRLVSASIPASDEAGPREANASEFLPPASIGSGSICRDGWLHFWAERDSYVQPGETGRDSCRFCNIWSGHSEATPSTSMWMEPIGTRVRRSCSFLSVIPRFILNIFPLTSQPSMSRSAFGGRVDMKSPGTSGSTASIPSISVSRAKSTTGPKIESNNYAS